MAELSGNIIKKVKGSVKEGKSTRFGVESNPDFEILRKSLESIKKEEFNILEKAALIGDKQAKLHLAVCCYRGIQTKINYSRAISLFKETAKEGCSLSLDMLGFHYMKEGDYIEALPFLKKSAENGYISAYLHLGILLIQGLGVSQDEQSFNEREGFRYIKLAADTGCGEALNSLGTCYALQKGIPEVDRPVYLLRAIDCYLQAMQAGSENAKESLLNMLKKENRYQRKKTSDRLNWSLCTSARSNDLKKLMGHINTGAKVNISREKGWTALHFACKRGNQENNFDCAKFLIFKMANIYKKNKAGKKPIDFIREPGIKTQMIDLFKFSKKARICLHIEEVERLFRGEIFFGKYSSKDFNKVIKLIDLGLEKMKKKEVKEAIEPIIEACDFLKRWLLNLKSNPHARIIPRDLNRAVLNDFSVKLREMGTAGSIPFTIKNFSLYILDNFIAPCLMGRKLHIRQCESLDHDEFRGVLATLKQALPPQWGNHFEWTVINTSVQDGEAPYQDEKALITNPPLKTEKEAEKLAEKLNVIEPFKGLVISVRVEDGYAVNIRNLNIVKSRIEAANLYRQQTLNLGNKGLLTLCKDFLPWQDRWRLALVNQKNYGLLSETLRTKKRTF